MNDSLADASVAVDAPAAVIDAEPQPDWVHVYAHSADRLYRLDPDTLEPSLVAPFSFVDAPVNITDIAVNKRGDMLGVSLGAVFAIDRETAAATKLADTSVSGFTSLSFVPDPANPTGEEILISANFNGEVLKIDPATGEATIIGDYGLDNQGNTISSSGDIVSVIGFGTVATVNVQGQATDSIAWINPSTFEASIIGDTGYDRIFGVGFWRGQVYGFTDNSEFLTIDINGGGAASLVAFSPIEWWGAGVSTIAPLIE